MSSLAPETPRDFGPGWEFWAYCKDEIDCRNGSKLESLDPDVRINDLRLVCSKCGSRDVKVQRVCVKPTTMST